MTEEKYVNGHNILIDHIALTLEFEDPQKAAILFGEFDCNIAYLEQQTGLEITAQGNQLVLQGNRDSCEQIGNLLKEIYEAIHDGKLSTSDDIKGAIKIHVAPSAKQEESFAKQPENLVAQIATRKKVLNARNTSQQRYMRAMENKTLVFGVGPAGTGKTYLAAAKAVAMLEAGEVSRVILSRPAVEAGERIGFLPGDMKEKVDPYLRPLYDAIEDMMPADKAKRAMDNKVIEIAPLAFMRGRTLSEAAIVLDEAQNTTTMQMKMFLTRLGEGSKMFVTGDPSQVDLPRGEKSGLKDALYRLSNIPDIAIQRFSNKDVVRHPLISKIIDAYDKKGSE